MVGTVCTAGNNYLPEAIKLHIINFSYIAKTNCSRLLDYMAKGATNQLRHHVNSDGVSDLVKRLIRHSALPHALLAS